MGSAGQNGFHDTALAPGPGVVVGRSGASFGRVHYCPIDYWPHNTALYVTNFKGNHPQFVYYLLSTIDFSRYNSGSAQPSLNRNYIYSIPMTFPRPVEQRAIAHILGTLDDKIELNRRMNETLEAMARAIFKSWFVDFDPVRAKLRGEQPAGLAPEIAALFPDALVESELGQMPRGWRESTVSAIALTLKDSVMPGKSPTKVWEHYSIPAFDAGRTPFLESGDTIKSGKYRVPSTCILVSKLNPQFPRVWYPNVNDEKSAICSTEFIPFVPPNSEWRSYLYELMKSDSVQRAIEERVTGSTGSRQRAKSDDIASIPVVVPPQELLLHYSALASYMHARIDESINESHTLAALRDTLLPRLISGELRVAEAERIVGRSV
jgi:type I restriction enzyme S subunit